MILATSTVEFARAFGTEAVLHRCQLTVYTTVEKAIGMHEWLVAHGPLQI